MACKAVLLVVLATGFLLASSGHEDEDADHSQLLYEEMYRTDYKAQHWEIGAQAALLHDVLIADSGPPSGLLFQQDESAVILDAGAGRGAVLHWLEKVQTFKTIKSAMGIELSRTAVESTPWPELLR